MILSPTLTLSAGSGAAIARPTFSRDFAGEKTLNNGAGPAINFTRASDATYFDADGVLRFAPNNHIRNSQAGGAVVGAPGTVPTNWFIGAQSGISTEVMATGTENGLAYVDVKFTGTNSTGGNVFPNLFFDTSTTVVASSGETWTGSFYTKIVAGSTAGLTNTSVQFVELTAAGAVVSALNTPFTPTSSLARYSATRTLTGATTERVYARFICTLPDGAQIGGSAAGLTLRFAAPQLERGSSATAYNPTTGTAFFGPRFDHDPATGASRGLLIEESRQNLLERSEEFDNAYWSNIDATVSANAATSPAATLTADRVHPSTNSAASVIFRNVAASASTAYSASVFVKAAGKTFGYLQINFNQTTTPIRAFAFTLDLSNGTLGSQQDLVSTTTGVTATATSVGSGWYRLSLSFTTTALTDEVSILFGPCDAANDRTVTASGTDGIFAWGAQLEAGAFPTSYIPTTSAAVTRSADSAIVNPISSFYNAAEGTLFAEASRFQLVTNSKFISLNSETDTTRSLVVEASGASPQTDQKFLASDGTNQAAIVFGSAVANAVYRMAAVYKVNDFQFAQNGSLGTADTLGTVPSGITRMGIGQFAAGGTLFALNGHIRKIAYWPRRLSNALLQALTT
jgi:hypothetical protein